MRCLIAVLVSLISSHLFGQSSATLTKHQIKADIEYLRNAVNDIPVNPYLRISKTNFLKELNNAEILLLAKTQVTIIDLYTYLQPVVVQLEDGHTELYINSYIDSTDYLVFPFELTISSGGLVIKSVNAGYHGTISDEKVGQKLTGINGYSSDQILDIINRYSSGEARNTRLALSGYLFNTIFNLFLRNGNEINIALANNKHLNIKAITKSALKGDGYTQQNIANYSYKLNEIKKTAVLSFNSFSGLNKFKKMLAEMFSLIREKDISSLIIDIRNNGGGDSGLGDELLKNICPVPFTQYEKTITKYSEISKAYVKANAPAENEDVKRYLTQKEGTLDTVDKSKNLLTSKTSDLRFKGNIYLLTSQATFSSAADFANAFKFYKIGKIVGEETGGFIISPGEDIITRLPNSQLELHISSSKDFDIGATDSAWHGVRPDIEVNQANALTYTIDKLIK